MRFPILRQDTILFLRLRYKMYISTVYQYRRQLKGKRCELAIWYLYGSKTHKKILFVLTGAKVITFFEIRRKIAIYWSLMLLDSIF